MNPAIALAPIERALPPESIVFGTSPKMLGIRTQMERVASANIPVLIEGESGTGKEVIARMLHRRSPWYEGPFVKVNCPAIPGTLIESELFGYEKGAFTGAYGTKAGRVEMANKGTLFLDEIGEMDMELQSKLLQVLQDGQFCRIGAQTDQKLDARIVCATNRSLQDEIDEGMFRQDLYYRINVVNLHLPPLRERAGDIPALIQYFIGHYCEFFETTVAALSTETIKKLQDYAWPGNVRELENVMKRYVILGSPDVVFEALRTRTTMVTPGGDFFDYPVPEKGSIHLKQITRDAVRKIERNIISKVLQQHQWNRKRAAIALNISYRALLYKLRETGLQSDEDEAELVELEA